MPFSCSRTCVVVAVVVLVGFVVAALACGRREAFDAGASDAVDTVQTTCASNTLFTDYKFIDPSNRTVCYPSEVYKRTNRADAVPPCASFRVQNRAVYSDNVYFGKNTAVHPLKRIVFPNQDNGETITLKDVLLDPEVQTRVNKVFADQKQMSNDTFRYHKKMQEYKTNDIQKAQDVVNNIKFVPHKVSTATQVISPPLPTPAPKSTIPNFKPSPSLTAPKNPLCTESMCDEYEEFEYTTASYGVPDPSSLTSTQNPPPTPNSSQAMRIKNVRIPPAPAPFSC